MSTGLLGFPQVKVPFWGLRSMIRGERHGLERVGSVNLRHSSDLRVYIDSPEVRAGLAGLSAAESAFAVVAGT